MTKNRLEQFLIYFQVDITKPFIELSGGNGSLILNPDTEWKEFLGYSINDVARAYANLVDKPTKYIE